MEVPIELSEDCYCDLSVPIPNGYTTDILTRSSRCCILVYFRGVSRSVKRNHVLHLHYLMALFTVCKYISHGGIVLPSSLFNFFNSYASNHVSLLAFEY